MQRRLYLAPLAVALAAALAAPAFAGSNVGDAAPALTPGGEIPGEAGADREVGDVVRAV